MRLVDADKIIFHEIDEIGGEYEPYLGCSKSQIDNAPTVEAIPKADYETRLKADMVAILVELQLEIEELRLDRPLFSRGYECYGLEDKTPTEIQQECSDIIQQKINELKEDQEGEE